MMLSNVLELWWYLLSDIFLFIVLEYLSTGAFALKLSGKAWFWNVLLVHLEDVYLLLLLSIVGLGSGVSLKVWWVRLVEVKELLLVERLGGLFHKNLFLRLGLGVEPKLLKGFFELWDHSDEFFLLVFGHVFQVISLIFDLIGKEPDTIPIFF